MEIKKDSPKQKGKKLSKKGVIDFHEIMNAGEVYLISRICATLLARLCHRSGTAVSSLWHSCANRVAQL